MFVDEYECTVRGGKGGDGCVSLRHEAYAPRGGPDGGDGGDGGSVILSPSVHENTLYHLVGRRVYAAEDGRQGSSSNCAGRKGEDLVLQVPVGTVVYDAEHGNVLKDLDRPDAPFEVARGGRGGRGNARFATATNRTPRRAETGRPGEERRVLLSVKLIADVGLIGLPNAGKSTLLARLSRARPKIADYPFTTLEPCLGIVHLGEDRTLVMADIPGLIEGAHAGRGLGDKFLKHVERTRVLLQLVDCSPASPTEPEAAWRVIRDELESYSPELAARPTLVVATKVEDAEAAVLAKRLAQAVGAQVLPISAATGAGLPELLAALGPFLSQESR
jgi:GTP-binding protein